MPVCVLHFADNNQYESRRVGKFTGSEKHALRPVFICSRLQYSKYLAAVRVTKGDQMWQDPSAAGMTVRGRAANMHDAG